MTRLIHPLSRAQHGSPWLPLARCVALILPLSCWACGSPAPAAAPLTSEARESTDPGESDSTRSELAAAEAATPPAACSDETCSPCGDGLCPTGFYCDEARGLCSWVPECAGKLSCDCLAKVVGNCTCETRDRGTYVKCDN